MSLRRTIMRRALEGARSDALLYGTGGIRYERVDPLDPSSPIKGIVRLSREELAERFPPPPARRAPGAWWRRR